MLVSGQVFSKITNITHDNKGILLMIKRLNHYEERTNFNQRRCYKHLEKEAVPIIRIQGLSKSKSPKTFFPLKKLEVDFQFACFQEIRELEL